MGYETELLRWRQSSALFIRAWRRPGFSGFRFFSESDVSGSDLMAAFRIGTNQASAGRYRCPGIAPDITLYGRSARACTRVEPQVLKPDSGSYLSQLQSICGEILTEGETWIGQLRAYD